jgi:transposase
MGQNFRSGDREQSFLMPPSVAEWLPADHLAWFIIDAVAELDLSPFRSRYRVDGRGGAAYDPALMLTVLVYAYAVGERSSRRIERRCVEDVAFRVAAANQAPDHATIARFRANHEAAIAGLFGQVLAVCAKAGVIRPGLVAVDGTKLSGNAAESANKTAAQIAEELAADILAEAATVDAEEELQAQRQAEAAAAQPPPDPAVSQRGAARRKRLREMLEELNAEAQERSYDKHMADRAAREAETGEKIRGKQPSPDSPMFRSRERANLTDPDSRLLKTKGGYLQGYNAQAVATEDQYVVAAEATNDVNDMAQFEPMITAARQNLAAAGVQEKIRQALADAGYWSASNVRLDGVETFIAPGTARKLAKIAEADQDRARVLDELEAGTIDADEACRRLGIGRSRLRELIRHRRDQVESLTSIMIRKLQTDEKKTYNKRAASIEPVFAQIKHNRKIRTLTRRGLTAVDSEWKLICATHNLLKLWRHQSS